MLDEDIKSKGVIKENYGEYWQKRAARTWEGVEWV